MSLIYPVVQQRTARLVLTARATVIRQPHIGSGAVGLSASARVTDRTVPATAPADFFGGVFHSAPATANAHVVELRALGFWVIEQVSRSGDVQLYVVGPGSAVGQVKRDRDYWQRLPGWFVHLEHGAVIQPALVKRWVNDHERVIR
jgi:hypothetical protein